MFCTHVQFENGCILSSAVANWMYSVFCKVKCVKQKFAVSYGLTYGCIPSPMPLNFAHPSSLRLNKLCLQCYFSSFKLDFLRDDSLGLDVFPLTCLFRCVKGYFANTSINLVHFCIGRRMYSFSGSILDVQN